MITDVGNTYIISLTVCFIAGSFLGVVLSENNNGYLGILVIIICDIIIFVWYYKNEPYIHRMYDSCQKMIYHCVISMIVFGSLISISFLIFNSILDENLDLILSQLLIAEVIIICVTLFHLFCFGKKACVIFETYEYKIINIYMKSGKVFSDFSIEDISEKGKYLYLIDEVNLTKIDKKSIEYIIYTNE